MVIVDILIGYLLLGFFYSIFFSRHEDAEDKYLDLILLWLCILAWPIFLWSDLKSFLKKGK